VSARRPRAAASPYEDDGFFVLRSPLLPCSTLADLAPETPPPDDPSELAAWVVAAGVRSRRALRALVARADVREALFLASSSLDARLDAWLASGEDGDAVVAPLRRYVQRMATRATPFGLFAGVAVGVLGEATALSVAPASACRRHTRIDARVLDAVVAELAADPEVRPTLRFVPNSTMYRAGEGLRYAESRPLGGRRMHHLVAVERSEALDLLLTAAADGATPPALAHDLAGALDGIDLADATEFVAEAIDTQILVPKLAPLLTGTEPAHAMADELARADGAAASRAHAALLGVSDEVQRLDASPLGAPRAAYEAVRAALQELPGADVRTSAVQVDLVKDAVRPELGRDVVDALLGAIDALHRIARPHASPLTELVDRFRARYEEREVPLVLVLDDECGIGFGAARPATGAAPLLASLVLSPSPPSPPTFSALDSMLLAKLETAWRTGAKEITLDEADLARVAPPRPMAHPAGLAAIATLLGAPADVAAGRFRLALRSVAAPTAAALLGRFCHGDRELLARTRALAAREQALDPDVVLAEVVHQPQGVTGNVACRPLLRDYEIVYLGASGAPADQRLSVDDLLVSVRQGRVVLRSRRLGKQVVPRLASAHNYASNATPIYHFLGLLQSEIDAPTHYLFRWGTLSEAAFLPRVVVRGVIVSPARYRVPVRALRDARTALDRFTCARTLRRELDLPRFVRLVQGDNELAVDLDDPFAIDAMVDALPADGRALFLEDLATEGALAAHGADGAYAHELIVPLVRRAPAERAPLVFSERPARASLPGSEWLYVKIYGAPTSLERVLRDVVDPLVRAERARIERWFFLRYGDPDAHVRLRFRGAPAWLHGVLLPALEARTRSPHARGNVHRVELGAYEPEVERYGGDAGLAIAEAIFDIDSTAALALAARHDVAPADRWKLALVGADDLLDALGLPLDARLALARAVGDSLLGELGASATTRRVLGQLYRAERPSLEALLARNVDPGATGLAAGLEALAARLGALALPVARLHEAIAGGRIARSLHDLAGSYVHMWINRALPVAPRKHEAVLYDLLARLYDGRRARGGAAALARHA
jgi:thiopeptide-type bacteriocin biosynthesis protein